MSDNDYYQPLNNTNPATTPPVSSDTPISTPPATLPVDAPIAEPAEPVESMQSPQENAGVEETTASTPEPVAPMADAPIEETPAPAEGTPTEMPKEADPQESYNAFIDQLIIQLGFDKVEGPEKEKLAEAIKNRVEARVLRTLMMSLSQEQQDKMDKKIQDENLAPEAIIKMLGDEAPNASDKITEALESLYQEMKEETDTIFSASAAKVAEDQENKNTPQDQSNQTQTPAL